MAYKNTLVSAFKSQDAINKLLKKQGIDAVRFSEVFGKKVVLEFGYQSEDGGRVIRYEVNIGVVSGLDGHGCAKTEQRLEKDREQMKRQAFRVLFYYLKTAFEAVESGLLKREDIFMPFFVLGDNTLLRDKIAADIQGGKLLLPEPQV